MRNGLAIIALCIFSFGCSSSRKTKITTTPEIQHPEREFRAAWIATVANINWPSKPGLTADQQKAEAIALLDFLDKNNFNAVILQVRPQCDALYESKLEPWSYFLSGEQGKPPSPYYDPLDFWITEAHDRGLELHVWLNPYRAHHKDGKEITEHSIVKTNPELVVYLKEGYWWMDPAQPATQSHSTAVVMDIVNRYDIDGVHFDDYFYPYPSYNNNVDFPDSVSWTKYKSQGGQLTRGDWRRNAVNIFIEQLYKKIKAAKPYVKFGISPFGIWRPGNPPSISGFDQYDQLYADAKLWLNKGWIDYFAPQLYWPINRYAQSFPVLLGWWAGENKMKRHLWPGINIGSDTSAKNVNEINAQLMITRGMLPNSPGTIHWSISSLTRNPNMIKGIKEGPYKQRALIPSSPWLDNVPPAAPEVTATANGSEVTVNWSHTNERDVFHWVLYYTYGGTWSHIILNRGTKKYTIKPPSDKPHTQIVISSVAVSAVDRTGNESEVRRADSVR